MQKYSSLEIPTINVLYKKGKGRDKTESYHRNP